MRDASSSLISLGCVWNAGSVVMEGDNIQRGVTLLTVPVFAKLIQVLSTAINHGVPSGEVLSFHILVTSLHLLVATHNIKRLFDYWE